MSAYRTVFIFSALMLFFPVFMYFFSRDMIFTGIFGMENTHSVFYSAMTAVVTVHVVLAMFLWVAFTEKGPAAEPTPPGLKKD